MNPSPINPENFQCDAFRAGNPQGVEKILETQLRVPMSWDAWIQSIHESFNKLEIDFFEWEVRSHGSVLGNIIQKTIPDADAILRDRGELKGIARGNRVGMHV